jgi:hypothetical protein
VPNSRQSVIQDQGCNHRPVDALLPSDLHRIFELATNEPLFPLGTFGLSAGRIDEEHLCLISQLLDGQDSMNKTFVKHLTDRLPPEFGSKNIQRLASLLSLMLQQDPKKGTLIADLLSHPFLVAKPASNCSLNNVHINLYLWT